MDKSLSTNRKSGPNKIVISVVVALIVAGALYGFGLVQGKGQMALQKADYEAQLQTAQTKVQQANQQVATLTERGHLMQSQLFLYRTAVDLDERNFGLANTNLKNAAASLAQVKNNAKTSDLQSAIAATNINVATNLETQRDKVLSFVQQLDALVPPTEMPVVEIKEPENSETVSPEVAPEVAPEVTAAPSEAPPATVQ